MTIDRETGNIILPGGQIIEKEMTIEEIKDSSLLELMWPESTEDEDSDILVLEIPEAHGEKNVLLALFFLADSISMIQINLSLEPERLSGLKEYEKAVDRCRNFLTNMTGERIDDDFFEWGTVSVDWDIRDMHPPCITILYL
ncbi:MAG TPA: hypothetical protein PLL17_06695 [Defluviitaleaceae bacterium]|jgi:hypothetical protein|nr:hypothetical protein [Candidatus Epulonipiscium sp.]HOK05495.1 hypothetical protein [Victivallales bacterium]HQD50803.1 hypothetical protein [Defluviitaleaceae bacterium]